MRELLNALDELLAFHRVLGLDARKLLRREYREIRVFELVALIADGIANAKDARVKKTDDVTGICRIDDLTVLCEELLRLCQLNGLAGTLVPNAHIALEFARADADEGQAVAVGRIHVGLDLEDKARESLVIRRDEAVT